MLAHRVVLRRGMEIEPEQWLASIDEETFRQWEAYYRLEPWGDEQAMLARVCSTLTWLLAVTVGGDEGKQVIAAVQDFMPGDWAWRREEPSEKASIAAFEKQVSGR